MARRWQKCFKNSNLIFGAHPCSTTKVVLMDFKTDVCCYTSCDHCNPKSVNNSATTARILLSLLQHSLSPWQILTLSEYGRNVLCAIRSREAKVANYAGVTYHAGRAVILYDMLPGSKLCRSDKSCKRSRCFLHMSPGRKLCRVDKSYRKNSLPHASPESASICTTCHQAENCAGLTNRTGRTVCLTHHQKAQAFCTTSHQAENCAGLTNRAGGADAFA